MTLHKIRDDTVTVQDNHHRYRVTFLRYIDNNAETFDDVQIRHVRSNGKPGRYIATNGQRAKEILERVKRNQSRRRASH